MLSSRKFQVAYQNSPTTSNKSVDEAKKYVEESPSSFDGSTVSDLTPLVELSCAHWQTNV